MVKVYVDDTRIAPEGWTQVWNIHEALDFIENNYEEITHIDFDYYLSENNSAHTGLLLLRHLKQSGLDIFHQPKENYTFHSSDSSMNKVMSDYLWDLKSKPEKKQVSNLQKLRSFKGRK